MATIIGVKKGMTAVYNDSGKYVPVTVVDVADCVYAREVGDGVEIGSGVKRGNNAERGRYKKLGFVPKFTHYVNRPGDIVVGKNVSLDPFVDGSRVLVISKSKGKGFAGVVKRWGFAGGKRTHGQSDRLRAPGSIGSGTTPGRVFKGKRMGGRMGNDLISQKSRLVKRVGTMFLIKGPVPGAKGDPVIISVVE